MPKTAATPKTSARATPYQTRSKTAADKGTATRIEACHMQQMALSPAEYERVFKAEYERVFQAERERVFQAGHGRVFQEGWERVFQERRERVFQRCKAEYERKFLRITPYKS